MPGSRKFFQRGSNFENLFFLLFFFFDDRRKDQYATISGPSSAGDGSPTLNAGLIALSFLWGSRPVMLRNPIYCDFPGRGPGPCFVI